MKDKENTIEILNDLIRINRDRIAGYEKAAEGIEEEDEGLESLFHQLADESQRILEELTEAVTAHGGEPAEDTTVSGKIYRIWMGVKDTFAGDDIKSTLEACEFGEDAAQKAYAEALKDNNLPETLRLMIRDEKDLLKMSHDLIRNKRDQYQETEHH
ncbi:MAG: aldehyde dehydrogenase [Marivirga sp.]|nr:aldehyde dehydrogenase [Marivirga sp.]